MMEEIERLAEEFLAGLPGYVWDGEMLPVPIEDIDDTHLGLLVRDVDDLRRAPGAPVLDDGHALSGLLLPALGEIWVNAGEARDWPPRRRFTIAHELGHWSVHRHDDRSVFCRSNVIEPGAIPERVGLPLPEQEANTFGAAVLMPCRLVRERYVQCGRDFSTLCETFGASGAAMGRRLHAVIKPARLG